MSKERRQLRAIAENWIRLGWCVGDLEAVRSLHAPNFIDFGAPPDRLPDRDTFITGIADLYAAFPDFHAEITDMVVDERAGSIAIRWTATGTHRGMFQGRRPTGKRIAFRGIEILHIRNGVITERWGEWDDVDLLYQLVA